MVCVKKLFISKIVVVQRNNNYLKKIYMATTNKREKRKASGKRELIAPKGDKRYIKRDGQGRINESDDQSRSLSRDKKTIAKTKVKPGYGDRGDRDNN